MSFEPGNLLYVPNYQFPNGTSKPKYFLVISEFDGTLIIANLPTSQDYIPAHIDKVHGCMDYPDHSFNCYHFKANTIICSNGFFFTLNTYMYGEWVDTFELEKVNKIPDAIVKGSLNEHELLAIIECFKNSEKVKNKIKKRL
tara:strand:- start:1313 stop:1738 length:426 start_codon:yes stop_codon:yes gene_type:complete